MTPRTLAEFSRRKVCNHFSSATIHITTSQRAFQFLDGGLKGRCSNAQ